jgi:hypothetical protein
MSRSFITFAVGEQYEKLSEILKESIELNSKYLPDMVFVKDGNLYNNISKFIKSLYFKVKVVNRLICFDDEENILSLYQMAFEELVEKILQTPSLWESDAAKKNVNFNNSREATSSCTYC